VTTPLYKSYSLSAFTIKLFLFSSSFKEVIYQELKHLKKVPLREPKMSGQSWGMKKGKQEALSMGYDVGFWCCFKCRVFS